MALTTECELAALFQFARKSCTIHIIVGRIIGTIGAEFDKLNIICQDILTTP